MSSEPGTDHPEVDTEAQVSLSGRGIVVSTRVEAVEDGVLVVRPSVGAFVDQAVVKPGDPVEILWRRPEDQRSMPAEVTAVAPGVVLRWRLRTTGPAEVTQRRKAVRAHVVVPVTVVLHGYELSGDSVDLSEGGTRVNVDGMGLPPEGGEGGDVRMDLDGTVIAVRAEVIRVVTRGARWSLSLRFLGLDERDEDRIRRRVFQALREERARLAD